MDSRCIQRAGGRWRGSVLPLVALMLPIAVGLLAFSVDTAVLGVAKAQLQSVSDSAALAGALALATSERLEMGSIAAGDVTNAQNQAVQFAHSNKVLGTGALLLSNAANTNTGTEDIVVGYMTSPLSPTPALQTAPATQPYMSPALQTSSAMLPYSNTGVVQASRSATHTGVVPAFFSAVLGNSGFGRRASRHLRIHVDAQQRQHRQCQPAPHHTRHANLCRDVAAGYD
jgi:Flp pilus assembly protein TadG